MIETAGALPQTSPILARASRSLPVMLSVSLGSVAISDSYSGSISSIHLFGSPFNDSISCHLNAIVDRYLNTAGLREIFKSTSRRLVRRETGHLMGLKLGQSFVSLDLARLGLLAFGCSQISRAPFSGITKSLVATKENGLRGYLGWPLNSNP